MAKMKFDSKTFMDEDVTEIFPDEMEILDEIPKPNPAGKKKTGGKIDPLEALNIAERVFSIATDLGNCFLAAYKERQETQRVKANAEVQIANAVEETERVRIQAELETTRILEECNARTEERKQELKILRENNRLKFAELKNDRKEFEKQLDGIGNIVQDIMKDKEMYRQLLLASSDDSKKVEGYLSALNNANDKLVEVSIQISNLRNGVQKGD